MTFSQGVADIRATMEFVANSELFRASQIALVTFSGASIEARKALASSVNRVAGWISVVGAADLKSGLTTVSGGQDFIGGCERGVKFGIQRILGIETDVDLVARDALDNGLAHLEDARCQMASVSVPITWIQGQHDAWINADRVREMLSCGDTTNRRLIEVPTGHQLRTSKEALETFQLIASEVGRFFTGTSIQTELPDLASLERRRIAERNRLPRVSVDLRQFWLEYLFGRDGLSGMELLTSTTTYRELIAKQVDLLVLQAGDRVADLGSGTGTLPKLLQKQPTAQRNIEVHEFDCLLPALSNSRREVGLDSLYPAMRFMVCDLSLRNGTAPRSIPVADKSYDAVVASLLLNYVDAPDLLLAEVRRVLRPGGRFVLSVLRKDTDISKIYVDVAAEIRSGRASAESGRLDLKYLEESVRSFLNQAARLVDLEELGLFHFWEANDLVALVQSAGFNAVHVHQSFGDPPQALVVACSAPRNLDPR
jgi:ubiquinone/menaquinone biosynthesis C-methylase UbiE